MAKKTKETAEDRIQEFLSLYDVKVLNLVIERHNLASEKRTWFSVRFHSEDPAQEKECTENMEKIDQKLYKIDRDLLEIYDIDSKYRTQIIRDIKKVRPDDWMGGFTIEEN